MTLLDFIEKYCEAIDNGALSFDTFLVKFSEHLSMQERCQQSVEDIKTSLPLPFYVAFNDSLGEDRIVNMEWKD